MHMSPPAELSALDDAARNLSEPLTPPDCDLRSSSMIFMPLDVGRMMDSDLFAMATGDEFKAAMALYAKAWLQVPAASLPNDDRVLAHLAGGYTLRRWDKIKDVALRGWILCTDGRLYHPVIAEFAHDAWEKSKHTISDATPTRRVSSNAERQRRYRERQKMAKSPATTAPASAVTGGVTPFSVTPNVTPNVTEAVTEAVTPVTPVVTPSFKSETKKEGENVTESVTRHGASTVTDVTRDAVTAPQRQLPILQAMPAAPGAHAPSPPPLSQTKGATPSPAPMDAKVKGKHPVLAPGEKHLAEQLWQSYAQAFQSRYDAPPLRDGRVNYQLASLARSLGQQAPAVAVHYLQSNHDWYVKKGHDLGTLLADASKVRADWMAASKRAAQLDAVRARNHQPPQSTPPKESPPAPETIRAQLAALQEKFTRRAASA
ncbi:MAG TPA: DUF1376 domain-containing protein [Thiomonas arsenitoxydans]|uniref:DUF1376 domain-containing protein n=1 Tax=Thiomonas TaxID=32012 RepID=UPI002580DB3A|nr:MULTISPECIES: DUF1376 domain-containing protein [Thiomonas]HML81064.1 DUF1376 domain-containing protein [Thiomonas arsenitoxydans]